MRTLLVLGLTILILGCGEKRPPGAAKPGPVVEQPAEEQPADPAPRVRSPRGIPALVLDLKSDDEEARTRAAEALFQKGEPAVPALVEVLGDEQAGPQAAAILVNLGQD